MANIDAKKVNMNILKTHVKALNESGLLPEPIAMKGTKLVLAAAFIGGIEKTNDIGKLDEVPEGIFNYYQEIVPPKDDPAAAALPAATTPAAAPAAKPATGRTTGAAAPAAAAATKPPAPPAAKKPTRADIFAELVTHKTPYTKEQLVEKMMAKFGGSESEAVFQIGQMTRTVLSLATKGVLAAVVNEKKQLVVG